MGIVYRCFLTFLISLTLVIYNLPASCQELFLPLDIRSAIEAKTRSTDGKPGEMYWQNSADYEMEISFDPYSRTIGGSAQIKYRNNSPDTLFRIVMRNYPDFFKKDALREFAVEAKDENDGVTIESISINNRRLDLNDKSKFNRDGTLMTLSAVILPGSETLVTVKWSYVLVASTSHLRTGAVDEGSSFIAYCFPRIAVYDDIEGWDESQYSGRHEPYADYGNYDVAITVPAGYYVWATGELMNAKEVLEEPIYNNYKRSLISDSAIYIIEQKDLSRNYTAGKKATFRFKAGDVPDFTFAVSNKYVWMGSSLIVDVNTKRRVSVQTAFNPDHKDYYEVNYFARRCVELMTYEMPGIAYPYPHITVFDGLDQMEFPMLINDNPVADRHESIALTVHEVFHTLLPFYTGANQTRYAWMDEGWATFAEWIVSPMIDSTLKNDFSLSYSENGSGREWDVPMISSSSEWNRSYSMNAYNKFALVLLYMKDILGDSTFNRCLQDFLVNWKSRHPSPWDFFNSVNASSGLDLNWFWQKWYYDFGEIDPSLKSVSREGDSALITVSSFYKPVPVNINIVYKDGRQRQLAYNASIWNDTKEFSVRIDGWGTVQEVFIHHDYVPDVNINNNRIRFDN